MLMATEHLSENAALAALIDEPASIPVELPYCVLLTEPNQEFRAERRLRQLGFNPFVPKERKMVNYGVRSARTTAVWKRETLRPIFRGYLFMPQDPTRSLRPIYECDGLRGNGHCFYKINGHHVLLRPREIEMLRQAERVCAEFAKPGSAYKVGQEVKYVDGPFAGIPMKIAKLDDASRIELLSDLLKGSARLHASVHQIEPA